MRFRANRGPTILLAGSVKLNRTGIKFATNTLINTSEFVTMIRELSCYLWRDNSCPRVQIS